MHNPYAAPQADLKPSLEPADATRLFAWNSRIGRARFVAYGFSGLAFAIVYFMVRDAVERSFGVVYARGSLVAPGTPNANRFGPVPPPTERSVLAAAVIGGLALLWFIVLRSP